MLQLAQIQAEDMTALDSDQVLALTLLVKRYPNYINAIASWPDLEGKLAEEQATPTVKTKALKAVLVALGTQPKIVVESSGSDDARSFFSSSINWEELAQDVLDTLYDIPIPSGSFRFALAQRRIDDAVLKENVIIRQRKTGRRF
jgi:hypothetical protein